MNLITKFYINYEVCKCKYGKFSKCLIFGFILTMRYVNQYAFVGIVGSIVGFILTMRYVNTVKLNTLSNPVKFYINYEVCKSY